MLGEVGPSLGHRELGQREGVTASGSVNQRSPWTGTCAGELVSLRPPGHCVSHVQLSLLLPQERVAASALSGLC